jgi:hypothetical protein
MNMRRAAPLLLLAAFLVGAFLAVSGHGKAFEFAVIAAAVTALASFLHNVAGFLPNDPTQTTPPPRS